MAANYCIALRVELVDPEVFPWELFVDFFFVDFSIFRTSISLFNTSYIINDTTQVVILMKITNFKQI